MSTYSFIALPTPDLLDKLNSIRQYLYTNGFRYSSNPPKADVHITLFEFEYDRKFNVTEEIGYVVSKFKPVAIKGYELNNRPHSVATNKFTDKPSNWIALSFDSPELRGYAKLISQHISGSQAVNADHLNLCNYARPEKSEEAIAYIKSQNLPEELLVDQIAVRDEAGNIEWRCELNS